MKKKKSNLERLLDFIKLTHRFQQIQRTVRNTGQCTWENDAEHTFQLAIVAWFVISSECLELDLDKVILFCLVHDWPEVYTGDFSVYRDKKKLLMKKNAEEKWAQRKFSRKFPEFSHFHKVLSEYKEQRSAEARFVYSLDKLLPAYNIMLDNGLTWKQFNTSFDTWREEKEGKIRTCPIGSTKFDELLIELRKRNGELFPSTTVPMPVADIIPLPLPQSRGWAGSAK